MAGNPRRSALFGVVSETCGLRRLDGGRTKARSWDPMIKSQRVFRFNCTGTYEIGGRNSVAKLARPFSPSANESGGLAVSTFRISSNAERVGDSQTLQDRTSSALRARAVLGGIARLLD